jgi:hypothetical protein
VLGYDIGKWVKTKMNYNRYGVQIEVETDEEEVAPFIFGLDTGASDNIIKPLQLAELEGVGKNDFSMIWITIAPLFVDGQPFVPGRFSVYDLNYGEGVDGILGYPFFEKHLVLLDFPNRTVSFKHLGEQ